MTQLNILVHDDNNPAWIDRADITHHATTNRGGIEALIIPEGSTAVATVALRVDFDNDDAVFVLELTGPNIEALAGAIRGVNERDGTSADEALAAFGALADGTARVAVVPTDLDRELRRQAYEGEGMNYSDRQKRRAANAAEIRAKRYVELNP